MTGSLTVKMENITQYLTSMKTANERKNGSVPIFLKRETSEEPNNSCEKCWRNMNVWKAL